MEKTSAVRSVQRQLQEEERTVKGTVCGEEVVAVVENSELFVTAFYPKTRGAITAAANLMVSPDDEAFFALSGLRISFVPADGTIHIE